MLGSKANWLEADVRDRDREACDGPEESIADWHERLALEQPR